VEDLTCRRRRASALSIAATISMSTSRAEGAKQYKALTTVLCTCSLHSRQMLDELRHAPALVPPSPCVDGCLAGCPSTHNVPTLLSSSSHRKFATLPIHRSGNLRPAPFPSPEIATITSKSTCTLVTCTLDLDLVGDDLRFTMPSKPCTCSPLSLLSPLQDGCISSFAQPEDMNLRHRCHAKRLLGKASQTLGTRLASLGNACQPRSSGILTFPLDGPVGYIQSWWCDRSDCHSPKVIRGG
jgi:hypothetical protein